MSENEKKDYENDPRERESRAERRERERRESAAGEISWGRLLIALVLVAVIIIGILYVSRNWSNWFGRTTLTAQSSESRVIATATPEAEAVPLAVKSTDTATEEPAAVVAKALPTEKPTEVSTEAPNKSTTETAAPAKMPKTTSTVAPKETTVAPTKAPTAAPKESSVAPTKAPTAAPKETAVVSTEAPTAAPKAESKEKAGAEVKTTAAPTEKAETKTTAAPAKKTDAPKAKTAKFELKERGTKQKAEVTLEMSAYEGGWKKDNDRWFVTDEKVKEVPEAFAKAISGKTWSDKIGTWLEYAVSDPWTMTWFRFQMGLEDFKDMDEVNKHARTVRELSATKYDELANETLTYFFKKLEGGTVEVSQSWALEVMQRWQKDKKLPELFARRHGDTNNTPDVLVTFFDRDGKNFVSNTKAFQVACKAAGVSMNDYLSKAYVNYTEGGTWKWKPGMKATPTHAPTPTPTPTPAPRPTPTPTPHPTKDPSVRPTPPIGGGPVNPENSEDPHTTDHVESTPARPTPTPKVTPTPTPVPTAVVRPTEICETVAPTPIREDLYTPPPANPGHNVPVEKPEGVADDSFDPDSI